MKVIDKLGKADAVTLALSRLDGGKIRVTSSLWADGVVILPDQVLEVRPALHLL
jgi:hypothetical protein